MRRLAVCVGVVLLLVPCLTQAATTSRLTGNVVDRDDAALPGVTVTLSSEILIGGAQVAITGVDGDFAFNLLPPGNYAIRTDLPGFTSGEVEVRVALDRATQVRIMMVMEEFAAEIEVTAEAPVVDTAQVTSGESYNESFLQNASVGMGGRDYLSVIGNEAGSVGSGNVRVLGGLASDNVFLIDGLNTTDPLTGTFGTNFNYDAIAEVSIQTSGFEAEFGQALGGIINLVTKSGGNQFSGAFDARYRDEKFYESGDFYDPDENIGSLREVSGTLGGPIARDKVWFFVSARDSLSERTPTGAPVTREFDGLDWIGKVTWQVAEAHRVVAKASGDPATITHANASRFIQPEASRTQDQGGENYQAELNSVLSDSVLLSLSAGINRGYLDSQPTSGDLDTPGRTNLDITDGQDFDNYFNTQFSDRDSDNYKGSVSYFVDNLAGPHELKAGLEYRETNVASNNYYTGDSYQLVYGLFDPDTNPGGSGVYDRDGDGYSDFELWAQLDPEASKQKEETLGDLGTFYIQDTWRPMPNLTVKPGVRLDTVQYTNNLGTKIADFEKWQPRIGIAWDFLGNGKQVLRAHWGTFMHPGASTIPDLVNGRAQGTNYYTGYEEFCILPDFPNFPFCDREWLAENRALDGQELVTIDAAGNEHYWYLTTQFGVDQFESLDTFGVGSLVSPYSENLSIAIERQLWQETSISLEWVDKKTRDLFEDVCRNNDWMWDSSVPQPTLDNPSSWTDRDACSGYVLANPQDAKRDYEAWIAKFETRYKGLHVLANYTYAKSQGSSSAEAFGSYATAFYDEYPRDFYNLYGYMLDDRRHRVKINGYWLLPYQFTIGASYFWSSQPALDVYSRCDRFDAASLEARGYDPAIAVNDYCQNPTTGDINLEPRGNRRGSANYQLDLQVTKGFNISNVNIEAIFSIINATGDERPSSYRQEEFLPNSDPDAEGFVPENQWGAVLSYTQPRRYEVGVRLEF